jgi:hypothetical protein
VLYYGYLEERGAKMAEYQTFHPENQALGSAILAAMAALDAEHVKKVMQSNGLEEVDPATWYSQDLELNILKSINTGNFLDLVSVGMKIPEIAAFPPNIQDVHVALGLLDMAYHMNVRGPNVGEYTYEKLGERSAKITAHNPYPSDFDYGLIYALVKRFRPADSQAISVKRDETKPNRKKGGDSCEFTISW